MSRLSFGKVCHWWNKADMRIRLCFIPRQRCNEPLFIPWLDWVLTLASDSLEKVRCGNYAGVLWMERAGDWRLHHTASPTWCLSPWRWADVQMASTWSLMNALVFFHQRGGSVWWLEKGRCHQGKSGQKMLLNEQPTHTHTCTCTHTFPSCKKYWESESPLTVPPPCDNPVFNVSSKTQLLEDWRDTSHIISDELNSMLVIWPQKECDLIIH